MTPEDRIAALEFDVGQLRSKISRLERRLDEFKRDESRRPLTLRTVGVPENHYTGSDGPDA